MEQLVERIRSGLIAGHYASERAVSTSIVVPILRTLGWDDSDPSQVIPEYANPRGRVDYALSAKTNSPSVFVEVKRVGQSAEADKQLFEYAFHEGAQIAVLTDGQLWNFYLPGHTARTMNGEFTSLISLSETPVRSSDDLSATLQRTELRLVTLCRTLRVTIAPAPVAEKRK
jgi:predicted type IV restriction endonuclease